MSDPNPDIVAQLQLEVAELRDRLAELAARLEDPYAGKFFLAKTTNDDRTTFVQRASNGGALVDFTDGIRCDDDSDPSALLDPGEDDVLVAEFEGAEGSDFVRIPFASGLTEDITFDVNTQFDPATGELKSQLLTLVVKDGLIKEKTLAAPAVFHDPSECPTPTP